MTQVSSQLSLMREVDDAVRLAASDRVLRLLIQNLPKLPERPAYRLFLAHYFLRRSRTADAIRVARHCLERGLATGDMVLAVGAQRLLEEAGETVAADAILALADLPRAAVGRGVAEPEALDLSADRPRLPQDLLISVALETAAGGPVSTSRAAGLGHVPGLTDMPPASLRWTLENLTLCTFEKGTALFSNGEQSALWWLWGALEADGVAGAPAPGSLVIGDAAPTGLRAASFSMALGLPSHFSDMWRFLPGVEVALEAASLRSSARLSLSSALGALLQAQPGGLELLGTADLGADEAVAEIPESTEVLLVLAGGALVDSADGQRFALGPGDAAALPLGAKSIRGIEQGTRIAVFARVLASPSAGAESGRSGDRRAAALPGQGATRPVGADVVPD